jgi:RNA polymerase-binding transcription factor DksA
MSATATKATASKATATKATASKAAPKAAPTVKPAKPVKPVNESSVPKLPKPKKVGGKVVPAKLQSTTKGDSTTITVTPNEAVVKEVVIEEKKLSLLPPAPKSKSSKKSTLKPIKGAPAPHLVAESDGAWSASELKEMRGLLNKDLIRLRAELAKAEAEMEELIAAAGVGAGDDQADAGAKTFEREHEMSLVYNARDMVLQTERAIARIDNKSYGRCEECGNYIGKARLQVFPRATLCMSCKQKEERR